MAFKQATMPVDVDKLREWDAVKKDDERRRYVLAWAFGTVANTVADAVRIFRLN
jgi:hypothetical protein